MTATNSDTNDNTPVQSLNELNKIYSLRDDPPNALGLGNDEIITPEEDAEDLEKVKTTPSQALAAFPDGGRTAWITVGGGVLILFSTFGFLNVIGVLFDYYATHQLKDYAATEIAWIGAVNLFFMFFGGFLSGTLFDALGPRLLLIIGSTLEIWGLFMISIAKNYWELLLSNGVLVGLGGSICFYMALNSVSTWFLRKRGVALAITVSGSSLGGTLLPIMFYNLLEEHGFGQAVRALAYLLLGCLFIGNLTIRSRLNHKGIKTFKFSNLVDLKAYTEIPYLFFNIGVFLSMWGMFGPFNYLPSYAEAHGVSQRMAYYTVSMLNAASIFGRIIPGMIADKAGRFNVYIVAVVVSGILVLAGWIPATTHAGIYVFAILFGFSSGAVVSLFGACVAQISEISKIGQRTGMLSFMISWAGLTGIPIEGKLLTDRDGDYLGVQLWSGILLLAGAVSVVIARMSLAKGKMVVKV